MSIEYMEFYPGYKLENAHFELLKGGKRAKQLKDYRFDEPIIIKTNDYDFDDCDGALRLIHTIASNHERSFRQVYIDPTRHRGFATCWSWISRKRDRILVDLNRDGTPENGLMMDGTWVLDTVANRFELYKVCLWIPTFMHIEAFVESEDMDEGIGTEDRYAEEGSDSTENSNADTQPDNTGTSNSSNATTMQSNSGLFFRCSCGKETKL